MFFVDDGKCSQPVSHVEANELMINVSNLNNHQLKSPASESMLLFYRESKAMKGIMVMTVGMNLVTVSHTELNALSCGVYVYYVQSHGKSLYFHYPG